MQLLAALPIREQTYVPHQAGTAPGEVAALVALLVGVLAIAALIVVGRARRGLDRLAFSEERARAEMDRLCAHGWTAQLTIYGTRNRVEEGAPAGEGVRVRAEWAELAQGDHGELDVAVARRLWSGSIPGALRAIVEDRRLDFELEQIERGHAEADPRGGADS
jgi:hypothetical protein